MQCRWIVSGGNPIDKTAKPCEPLHSTFKSTVFKDFEFECYSLRTQ